MKKILITISYNGHNYCGYQLQNDKPTISLKINRATKEAFGFECDVKGCSRTDSGVHALGFCATVEPKNENDEITVPIDKIPIAMNIKLPNDISVISAKEVDKDFHPRYDAKKKEYVYRIHASKIRNPFYTNLALELGREISDDGVEKMTRAAAFFKGTHNFDAFMSVGSQIENTERTVYEAKVERNGDFVEFTVCADGFLYNMVRIMCGTALAYAEDKITLLDIEKMFDLGERSFGGRTLPAKALCLKKVEY